MNPDGSVASSTIYSYSYDGLNLNPTDKVGQEGFLTGVSSDFFPRR